MSPFSKPLITLSLTEPDDGVLHYAARLAEWFEWNDAAEWILLESLMSHRLWEQPAPKTN